MASATVAAAGGVQPGSLAGMQQLFDTLRSVFPTKREDRLQELREIVVRVRRVVVLLVRFPVP